MATTKAALEDIDHSLNQLIYPSPQITGHQADSHAQQQSASGGEESDEHRRAAAVDKPAQQITADMVGTQPVFSGGGGKAVGHIHRVGVAGCQKISKDPYQQEKNKHS